ncbi:hypothetical protein KHQ84_gp118 [Rhodococcus phage Finch]|uniref:Uncharacterized protein n=1 Tax=Rhodococcus phage Finch TaxID=2094144 RepID=A0A2P1JXJ1_9CAUD|nr:hypothetical protein KHQ84_gp118 [Rhodococcus phage Finch]AVO25049.1 hypothetical protein SEA_FINCH_118 [Rhodococcus phage Finch]
MSECVVYGCTNPVGEGLKHGCGHHFHGDFNQTVLIEHDPTSFTFAPILKPLGLVSLRPEEGPFLKADILGVTNDEPPTT